jgi:hypothetical protein
MSAGRYALIYFEPAKIKYTFKWLGCYEIKEKVIPTWRLLKWARAKLQIMRMLNLG